jgi:hypothetical protein
MPSLIFFPPLRSLLAMARCVAGRMLHIRWPDNRLTVTAAPPVGVCIPKESACLVPRRTVTLTCIRGVTRLRPHRPRTTRSGKVQQANYPYYSSRIVRNSLSEWPTMDTQDAIRFWTFHDGTRADDARSPVTDSQLTAFSHRFCIQLPPALIELYRQQNGGFSDRFESLLWPICTGESDDATSLRILCGTYHEDEDLERQWTSLMGDLANVIVFLGDGHFYYVLNYNRCDNGDPIVWYVDENGARSTGQSFAQWIAESLKIG